MPPLLAPGCYRFDVSFRRASRDCCCCAHVAAGCFLLQSLSSEQCPVQEMALAQQRVEMNLDYQSFSEDKLLLFKNVETTPSLSGQQEQ